MKKLIGLVLAMLLCAGSALADVTIPDLPGGTDRYVSSENRSKGYTEYRVFNKSRTCTDEEFDAFVRQLKKMGFRNEGTENYMEFVYTKKGASSLGTFKGNSTDAMHVLVWNSGFGLTIRLADGVVIETADAKSSATETQEQLKRFAVVVEVDGVGDYYTFETDKEYVLDALLEDGFVKGEEASWGFNVTTVAGTKADYSRKGEYWSILEFNKTTGQYEPMMESLDGRKVEDGMGYTFVLVD